MGQKPPTSIVRNITMTNVKGSFENFGIIKDHDRTMLSDIRLKNFNVKLSSEALELGKIEGFSVKNVIVNGKPYKAPERNSATSSHRHIDDL
jgi:hypothetical protein